MNRFSENNLDIHFPLVEEIIEGQIHSSALAKNVAHEFLLLPLDVSVEELETNLHRLLQQGSRLPQLSEENLSQSNISKLQKEHEQYFSIKRYANHTGDLMIWNILQSYLRFVLDFQLGSQLLIIDLGHINSALRSLVQYILSRSSDNEK